MKRYLSWLPGIVIICLLGWSGSGLAKMAVAPVVEDGPGVVENRRAWPLFFEANRGQAAGSARFLARGLGYQVFLTPTEAVLVLDLPYRRLRGERTLEAPDRTTPQVARMRLVDANPDPAMRGVESLPGKVNRLRGNDPKRWRTDIPTFAKVHLEAVYPGIDLVYYGTPQQLEYDFIVAPGAGPERIRWAFSGARPTLAANGDLLLQADAEVLHWRKPLIYQMVDGRRREVEGHFVLYPPADAETGAQVGFQVAAYDRTQPLIIDPVLEYSATFGGSGRESPVEMTVDGAGNAYMAGYTYSPDFLTANAFDADFSDPVDLFVVKLDPSGAMIYATYLGGSAYIPWLEIPAFDAVSSLALDGAGNAYVLGTTYSTDFPTVNAFDSSLGGLKDVFIVKLDPVGKAVYATFLGGDGPEEPAGRLLIDDNGNAYVAGMTWSSDFPMVNAFDSVFGEKPTEVFVAKFDPDGRAIYATYLGGSGYEELADIAIDHAGSVYVAGRTDSADFPTANAFDARLGDKGQFPSDAFLVKLDADGSAIYSTYLGGSQFEVANDLAVDDAGNAYLVGITSSVNFPTVNAFDPRLTDGKKSGHGDVFLAKFDSHGQAVYATYLGGSGWETAKNVAVDKAGNAYVAGMTSSRDFPVVNAVDRRMAGGKRNASEAFVAGFAPDGRAIYATYLGGRGDESVNYFTVDDAGNAYVVGITSSSDFPTRNAFDSNFDGSEGPFIVKLDPAGQAVYATYLDGGGYEYIQSFAVDKAGNTYVAGYTNSVDFPLVNAFSSCFAESSGFLAKFDPQGQASYATCLGSPVTYANGIALDDANHVYVSGQLVKSENDFDAFLMKVSD
ncbi:MAG TPA: SBBP repeat-containing protein [Candidatus Competibacter sp.]|nr:SBBP repeat-containing protein [Candidatus Competibacter sp.]